MTVTKNEVALNESLPAEFGDRVKYVPADLELIGKDEIIAEAKATRDKYAGADGEQVITDANYAGNKEVKTALKSKRDALNEARLIVQRKYKEPLNKFEGDIKEAISIIDESYNPLDQALKDYDKKQKELRHENVLSIIDQICKDYGVDPNKVEYDSKWDNKSYSAKKRQEEIELQAQVLKADLEKLNKNLNTISQLAKSFELEPEGYLQQLKDGSSLSDVQQNMIQANMDKKNRLEREKKSKEAEQAVQQMEQEQVNHQTVDTNTGEIIATNEYVLTLELRSSNAKDFVLLKQFLDDHNIKSETLNKRTEVV